MRNLPLNSLRAFAVVFRRGGIRPAARDLGVAHSAVSRHVRELEAWLGIELVGKESGGRRLAFTPQGEALGRATLEGLGAIDRAVSALREARSSRSVFLGTAASFAARWLLPRLPRLETSHPNIELSVVVDSRLGALQRGGLDLMVAIGNGPYEGLVSEPLTDDALYPVMSPTFWRRRGRPSRPADLVGLRLLHDRDLNASWEIWKEAFGPEELDVRSGPRFTSTDLVLRAAAHDQGVALARHRLAVDDLEAGTLVRPVGDLEVTLDNAYWILRPKHAPLRPAVDTVIQWLKREAAVVRVSTRRKV